jgi:glycosyltransferase involved in cell wall biosynthesis
VELSEKLSVVIPVWNEEHAIRQILDEVDREVAARFRDAEIIVVDDASTDRTSAILAEVAAANPRVSVWRIERNRGHGPSVLTGLAKASGDWIFQLDSDGQFVVSEFWELWRQRESGDLLLGTRHARHDPRHRLVLSRLVAFAVSVLAGARIRDANTPFRLMRRSLWDDLRPLIRADALAPSILLTVGASARSWRVLEVPVTHLARTRGVSSLRAWRLVRFSARGLGQLVAFRLALKRRAAV